MSLTQNGFTRIYFVICNARHRKAITITITAFLQNVANDTSNAIITHNGTSRPAFIGREYSKASTCNDNSIESLPISYYEYINLNIRRLVVLC